MLQEKGRFAAYVENKLRCLYLVGHAWLHDDMTTSVRARYRPGGSRPEHILYMGVASNKCQAKTRTSARSDVVSCGSPAAAEGKSQATPFRAMGRPDDT